MTENVATEGAVGRDSMCFSEEGLSQSEAHVGSDVSRTQHLREFEAMRRSDSKRL